MIFIVITLNILFIKRRSRFSILKNKTIILNNKREINVIINIDNEKIFISQSFIKETQNFEFEYVLIIMRVINNYRIFLYKTYNLIFDFADNRDKK